MICEIHGEVKFYKRKNRKTGYYCSKCWIDRMAKFRADLKKELVEMLGGSCSRCGYNECFWAMHFHHVNPSQKTENVSEYIRRKATRQAKEEAKNCILLCGNCHSLTEYEIQRRAWDSNPQSPLRP